MVPQLSPLLAVTDVNFVRSFAANVLFLKIGADAEHRAGPPLTLATMARDNGIGIT
jgi:hypothetical protein